MADGQEYSHLSRTCPTQAIDDEGEAAVEVRTGNTQAENHQIKENEEHGTDVTLENNSVEDETTSLASDLADPEDARNFIPTTEGEYQALTDAIYPTMLQYVGITGRIEMSDARENYFSQWAFYQQHMNAFWARCGLISVPPRLVSRDRWIGRIENWRSGCVLNSGKLTGDLDK